MNIHLALRNVLIFSIASGGVTHMKFIPGTLKLVSGARKDHRLFVWDIRYYRKPLNILSRVVNTNQRIYFDISPCGKYLVSGGTDGVVKVWSLDHIDWHSSLDPVNNTTDDVTYKVLFSIILIACVLYFKSFY